MAAYQTPVAGYPWAIPFEFPIYQGLVAVVSSAGRFDLDTVGRLVSFAFLLGCAWPAFGLARRLKLPGETAWIFCALLWSSPLYLFWGRAFMIETTAVFFTFAAIPFAVDLLQEKPSWKSVVFCAVLGALGTLQKVTTAGPVFMVLGFVWAWKRARARRLEVMDVVRVSIALGLPVVLAAIWTKYSETVRAANPLGADLAPFLNAWGFGTVAQRLEPSNWRMLIWSRTIGPNAGGLLGIAIILGAVATSNRNTRSILATALGLFLFPILIFFNLQVVHEYYQVASSLFLIGSLSIAVAVWLPEIVTHQATVPFVAVLLVGSNVAEFRRGYGITAQFHYDATNHATLGIAKVLRESTAKNSAIVVFGNEWSSELPYYSGRKGFVVPAFFTQSDRAWSDPASFVGDLPLSAIVIFKDNPAKNVPTEAQIADQLVTHPQWRRLDIQGGTVLLTN